MLMYMPCRVQAALLQKQFAFDFEHNYKSCNMSSQASDETCSILLEAGGGCCNFIVFFPSMDFFTCIELAIFN